MLMAQLALALDGGELLRNATGGVEGFGSVGPGGTARAGAVEARAISADEGGDQVDVVISREEPREVRRVLCELSKAGLVVVLVGEEPEREGSAKAPEVQAHSLVRDGWRGEVVELGGIAGGQLEEPPFVIGGAEEQRRILVERFIAGGEAAAEGRADTDVS